MSQFVFVTWDGGGNLPPALGIARALGRDGYDVVILGHETQRRSIEAAGLTFTPYTGRVVPQGVTQPEERLQALLRQVWMNTDLADDLLKVLAENQPDVVVVDCMLEGVLTRSDDFGASTAVLVHGLYHSILPMREPLMAIGNQLRLDSGQPVLDLDRMRWEDKDLVLVTTLHEFDGVKADPAPNVRYVGPVLPAPGHQTWESPWAADDEFPLVLVSLSTMPGQTPLDAAQQVLDALASAPVHVVMTTGAVPPEALSAPANAAVFAIVPHSLVLPNAALMITHGGHGSVMGALAAGVPLVCVPGVGADQPVVAGRVEALGAGKTVSLESVPTQLRAAAIEVLSTTAYRESARQLAGLIEHEEGASKGASVLEGLVSSH